MFILLEDSYPCVKLWTMKKRDQVRCWEGIEKTKIFIPFFCLLSLIQPKNSRNLFANVDFRDFDYGRKS